MDAGQSARPQYLRTDMMRHTMSWYSVVMMITIAGCSMCVTAEGDEPTLSGVNQLLAARKVGQAAEALRALDDQIKSGQASGETDLTFPLAVTARAFQQADNLKDAAEFFQRAVAASKRDAAKSLPVEKIGMVRLAAASTLSRHGDQTSALDALTPLLKPPHKLTDAQKQLVMTICLHVGSESLSSGKPEVAETAYYLAVKHCTGDQRATAMLGAGWATAMQQTKPKAAAQKLAAFVEAYPAHADAQRAVSLQVTCLRQAGEMAQADQVVTLLLERWPESDAAEAAISQYTPGDSASPAVQDWLLKKAAKGELQAFDAKLTAVALVASAEADNDDAWTKLSERLAAIDSSGQPTSDVLQGLSKRKLDAFAQRLAAKMIVPKSGANAHAGSREAACRWVGRQQHWSMLALASELSDPEKDEQTRTPAIERLYAEALMQTGRPEDSREWWIHLVDVRKVTDFPTLLRCAETASSLADVKDAGTRIDAAREAAGKDAARIALVDMLSADLAVRQLQFDKARWILESVVESSQSVSELRGRAQWMIGETYFLQQKFTEAIEAYRRVEGIDPEGPWVVVSLVQAGKSFEQLGRAREAAVCYSNLLSRFADSQHASVARRRLAAIDPNPGSAESNSTSKTIRR